MASVIKANPPNGDVIKGKSGSISSASRKSSKASLTRENSGVSITHENGVDGLEEVQNTEEDKPTEHSEDELEDFQRTDEERQPDLDTENILKVCLYQSYIVISKYFEAIYLLQCLLDLYFVCFFFRRN